MTTMRIIAFSIGAVAVAACATSPATTLDDTNVAISATIRAALGEASSSGPFTLTYSGNCVGGGTGGVTGTYQPYGAERDNIYDDATSDLMFTFAACSEGGPALTGTVDVNIDGTPQSAFSGSITGTITGGGVTSCALDVNVAIEVGLSTMLDGTVCGNAYDVTQS
jgi:hypothetical protein